MKKIMIYLVAVIFATSSISISTYAQKTGTFTDSRNGHVYKTVKIGNQVWMAENLAYEGAGQQITDDEAWYDNINYDGWCYYDNDKATYGSTYGVLYQWKVATDACPSGWHVPSDAEWIELTDYIGGSATAVIKLKESGTSHWNYYNDNVWGTDEYGFTALPGGIRYSGGAFDDIGISGYFWSSTELSTTDAWYRVLYNSYIDVHRSNIDKEVGFSVRCLRD